MGGKALQFWPEKFLLRLAEMLSTNIMACLPSHMTLAMPIAFQLTIILKSLPGITMKLYNNGHLRNNQICPLYRGVFDIKVVIRFGKSQQCFYYCPLQRDV